MLFCSPTIGSNEAMPKSRITATTPDQIKIMNARNRKIARLPRLVRGENPRFEQLVQLCRSLATGDASSAPAEPGNGPKHLDPGPQSSEGVTVGNAG
jgi:hypothetical protein